MTLTAEFTDAAYPPRYSITTKDRQPDTSQHDEETTISLQVTPPARRIRTDKHLPGFSFQEELQQAAKPFTDTLAILDVLKSDSALRTVKDELRHISKPLDAMGEVERFLKKTGLYQVQKFMDDLNRPFH